VNFVTLWKINIKPQSHKEHKEENATFRTAIGKAALYCIDVALKIYFFNQLMNLYHLYS